MAPRGRGGACSMRDTAAGTRGLAHMLAGILLLAGAVAVVHAGEREKTQAAQKDEVSSVANRVNVQAVSIQVDPRAAGLQEKGAGIVQDRRLPPNHPPQGARVKRMTTDLNTFHPPTKVGTPATECLAGKSASRPCQ